MIPQRGESFRGCSGILSQHMEQQSSPELLSLQLFIMLWRRYGLRDANSQHLASAGEL